VAEQVRDEFERTLPTLLKQVRGPDPDLGWQGLAELAEAFKGTSKSLSGLVAGRLEAYTLGLQEAHKLLEALFRHEISLSGTTVEPGVHTIARLPDASNFTARVNLAGGEITIARDVPYGDARDVQVKLQLLSRVGRKAPELAHGPANNAHAFRLAKDIQKGFTTDLVVPIDLAELKRRHTSLPAGFTLCAEILNVSRAAITIADNLRRGKGVDEQLEPAWDLAKGVVALADSHQAMLKAMQRPLEAKSFLSASKLAGLKLGARVVSGVDGLYKLRKGTTILFSDDGDLAYALRQGRDGRATLQALKGVMQVAQGALGVVAAIPATAGLAATPVGLVIAVGSAVVVATADVILDATQEFIDQVDAFERALDGARRRELLARSFRGSASMRAAVDLAKGWA
jgi:hypothetical protein